MAVELGHGSSAVPIPAASSQPPPSYFREREKAEKTAERVMDAEPSQSFPKYRAYSAIDLENAIEKAIQIAQNPAASAESCLEARDQLRNINEQLKDYRDAQAYLIKAKCHRGLVPLVDQKAESIVRAYTHLGLARHTMTPDSKALMLPKIVLEFSKLWEIAQTIQPQPEDGFKDIKTSFQQLTLEAYGEKPVEKSSWLRTALWIALGLAAVANVKIAIFYFKARSK